MNDDRAWLGIGSPLAWGRPVRRERVMPGESKEAARERFRRELEIERDMSRDPRRPQGYQGRLAPVRYD